MDENEQFVRSKWLYTEEFGMAKYGTCRILCGTEDEWFYGDEAGFFSSQSDAWAAARAFTEDRLKQIAEMEEEIKLVKFRSNTDGASGFIAHVAVWTRILAILQSQLETLQRGMVKR